MSNWVIEAAKAALVVGLFAYLVQSGLLSFADLGGVGERWPWLVLAQLPFSLLLLAAALRWHLLLRAQAVDIAFRDTYAIMLIGWLFNQTMPSSTGGDVAKAAAIGLEQPERRTVAIMSIFVDRFTGLLSLLLFALVASAFSVPMIRGSALLTTIWVAVAMALLAASAAAVLFYSRRFRTLVSPLLRRLGLDSQIDESEIPEPTTAMGRIARGLRRIDEAVFAYRDHPRALVLCFAASLFLHSMTIALNLMLTWIVLGRSFDWTSVLLIIPMAHIGIALGITPGSIGIAEGIYGELFRVIGIGQGATIGLLQRLTWYAWAAVGAAVFVGRRKTGRGHVVPQSEAS